MFRTYVGKYDLTPGGSRVSLSTTGEPKTSFFEFIFTIDFIPPIINLIHPYVQTESTKSIRGVSV